jgi:subtilisin family serine protease
MKNMKRNVFTPIAIALLLISIFSALPLVTARAPVIVTAGDFYATPFCMQADDFQVNGAYPPGKTFTDFVGGIVAFDQDMIDVEQIAHPQNKWYGRGIHVAVLDTGMLPNWNYFFPKSRIDADLGIGFVQDLETGEITAVPWDDAVSGHGTHVASTIIGYNYHGYPITGVAPLAKIIPVKVLSFYDYDEWVAWGTSGMVAAGIDYITSLVESGVLEPGKVIINMSLGALVPMAEVEEAIDRAIAAGVIVVAAAGNAGLDGMDYPGAYPQVISAGAAGWTGQWHPDGYYDFWLEDVPEDLMTPAPLSIYFGAYAGTQTYMTYYSGWELEGQDLDVAAPGSWCLGPYWTPEAGDLPEDPEDCYWYVGGTSMAAPHVAGTAALLAEKKGRKLTQSEVETILESTADIAPLTFVNGGWLGPLPYMAIYELYDANYYWTEWDDPAVGAGLLQTDAAVEAVAALGPH